MSADSYRVRLAGHLLVLYTLLSYLLTYCALYWVLSTPGGTPSWGSLIMAHVPSALALAGGLVIICQSRPTLRWTTALECMFGTGVGVALLLQTHSFLANIGCFGC